MKIFAIRWYHQWKELLRDKKYTASLFAAAVLLCVAYYINYRAALYTTQIPVLSVGDLILDYIPTIDLSFMFTFGIYFTALIFVLYPLLFKPQLVPFAAKTVAAFILIRAFSISLTHLGAPENYFHLPQLDDQPGMFKMFYMNDLFFSGHTGFPFLGALIFWETRFLRYFLLAMSGMQSVTVLFMHVHYSIDVFAAYFITYSIYVISDKLLRNLTLSFKRIVTDVEARLHIKSPPSH
ncbi:MAG: phosphatase PAP2-related protein [Patescibacteria group bacterium]